jgi:hypothetical protein
MIGQEVSAYFRPQTSKFRLYSWHFRHRNLDFRLAVFTINFCAHRPKPSFSRGLVDDPQPMSNMAASAVFTIKIVLKKMASACVHKNLL